MGFPSFFIGVFGFFGIITGAKLVAGAMGAVWGYLAAVGAYELIRRKLNWTRGSKYRDRHLLAGTVAASTGMILGAAMNETMPGLALVPAISAVMQANDGHNNKYPAIIHTLVLATGIAIAIWVYTDGIIGKFWMERIEALP